MRRRITRAPTMALERRADAGLRTTLRERGREWLGVAGVCLGLALAYSFAGKLRRSMKGELVDWSAIPTEALLHFGCWALLYPCVAFLTARFPLGERRRRSLPLHAAAALVFSPLLMALTFALNALVTRHTPTWRGLFQDAIIPEYAWGVTAYIVFLSIAHAAEFRRRDQARALRSAQLEAALATARLSALRMQLEPHFLFNALNSISSLLHRDPHAAERMLARLGDFLRLTLDDSMPQQVELRQELEFLDRYLDIERVRFSDRLTVSVEVPSDLADARVPYLLLQPIVENAVRHGVAARAGLGRISVRASASEGILRLEVEDDGPGLPKGAELPKAGVGLSNIRSRLQQLYGHAAELRLSIIGDRGLSVTITLPHERGAGAARAPEVTP